MTNKKKPEHFSLQQDNGKLQSIKMSATDPQPQNSMSLSISNKKAIAPFTNS